MTSAYKIKRRDGRRWYDFPYEVTRAGEYVGMAMTFRGARYLIRKDRREQAAGVRVVYAEPVTMAGENGR